MASESYDNIPLGQLPIEEVIWSPERAMHIRTRSQRKHHSEVDIEPEWATEAALDPYRLVRRGNGEDSVEIVGYSPSAGRVLMVWVPVAGASADRHVVRR